MPLSNLVVLVVDDHEDTREILSLQLGLAGAVPLAAPSAEQALAVLESGRCDVIVTDLRLPGHDGRWLLEQVSRRPRPVPVIAMTGYSEPAGGGGFAAWLLKPVAEETLVAAIAQVMRRGPRAP